jgi:hypothetical protein
MAATSGASNCSARIAGGGFSMNKALLSLLSIFVFAAATAYPATTVTRIPQLVVGGAYASILNICDPHGVATRKVTVNLYDDNGSPLQAIVETGNPVSTFAFDLTPYLEKSFLLWSRSDQSQAGWVEIISEGIGRINSSLRFEVVDKSSNLVDCVGILPAEPSQAWTVAVNKRYIEQYVGVALANPSSQQIVVAFDLYSGISRVPGTTTVKKTLPARGHTSIFVHQLFGGVELFGDGTLTIYSSDGPFSSVALRLDESQLSSLPAEREAQQWRWTLTDATGTSVGGEWSFRFLDEYSFVGHTKQDLSDAPVRFRGSLSDERFVGEWLYTNTDGSRGTFVFQGTSSYEGSNRVINGKGMEVRSDGTLGRVFTLKASQLD